MFSVPVESLDNTQLKFLTEQSDWKLLHDRSSAVQLFTFFPPRSKPPHHVAHNSSTRRFANRA